MKSPFAALALSAAALLALAGCAGTQPAAGEQPADAGIRVVATTTQVADFTRALVGDDATVTQLIQPNQSAHSFEPTPADLLAMGEANVLVSSGSGLEEWLDDAVEASGFDGEAIVATEGIELSADEAGHEGETAEEHADHAGEEAGHEGETAEEHAEHAGETAETGHEDEHAHAAGNPHVWTDPRNAATMVATIAEGLERASAADADAIAENAERYTATLTALDEWSAAAIDAVPAEQRLLVTNHDAFGYFVERYGITYVGSVLPGFDDNAEPSAAEIDELVAAIRATGTRAVFSETSISPRAAATIAEEADVAVYDGDDALYGDSLGPDGSDGATYVGSQVHNVRVLVESWGATPPDLPAAVSEAV
ncbi:metal ABC transporter substrate-binding protein [Planctomonas deserti]|uniref:metal ABC transporter substrate-binding protein n=1 Tax=Planctomonas deserti TaxID=2144185 RepID=UPI000D3850BE|nr:metal ABC transporter substrate-binding protein [Planctomonas deserti]